MTSDGTGLASHAGSLLLAEMADRSGLTAGLSAAMAHTRKRASRHDPGTTLAHLAVMLADGGDCMSDLAVLCNQLSAAMRSCTWAATKVLAGGHQNCAVAAR